jgi:hypothetical protein
MQAEPLGVIKLDASSREAGAFKAEAIVNYASALITQQMEASGSCNIQVWGRLTSTINAGATK